MLILKNEKKKIFFSRGFNFANWLPADFLLVFNFANLAKFKKITKICLVNNSSLEGNFELIICDKHFFFGKSQNSFLCFCLCGLFWSVNTLILDKSYQFRQATELLQKSGTVRILKVHIIFCSLRWAEKSYQLMG